MPLKIFLDTNVWFSSLYGSENCRKLTQAATEKKFIPVISHEILDELVVNLKKKIPRVFPFFEKMIITVAPLIITTPEKIPERIIKLVDQKDQKIFTAAMKAKVDCFVTGNIKDFSSKKLEKLTGIKIITPKETVRILHI